MTSGCQGWPSPNSSGESDYSYRKSSGANDGGRLSSQVTSSYPYGSVQLRERLRLRGLAGFGFGSQHHHGGHKAKGKLRLQMGVVGFTRQLDAVGALQLSLAGDLAVAKSTTDRPAASVASSTWRSPSAVPASGWTPPSPWVSRPRAM